MRDKTESKVLLSVMRVVRKRLNAECTLRDRNCPEYINNEFFKNDTIQFCKVCESEFHWLKSTYPDLSCPCARGSNPDEIRLRLNEFIVELEKELQTSEEILFKAYGNYFKFRDGVFYSHGCGKSPIGSWFNCDKEEVAMLRKAILSGNFKIKRKLPGCRKLYAAIDEEIMKCQK